MTAEPTTPMQGEEDAREGVAGLSVQLYRSFWARNGHPDPTPLEHLAPAIRTMWERIAADALTAMREERDAKDATIERLTAEGDKVQSQFDRAMELAGQAIRERYEAAATIAAHEKRIGELEAGLREIRDLAPGSWQANTAADLLPASPPEPKP